MGVQAESSDGNVGLNLPRHDTAKARAKARVLPSPGCPPSPQARSMKRMVQPRDDWPDGHYGERPVEG